MKDKKKQIINVLTGVFLVALFVGATYAYYAAKSDSGKITDVEITANTVDVFTFLVGDPIDININQENFASGKGSMSGSTFASAMLSANNKTNTATEHYYLYVNIQSNTFVYSKDTDHPEIIMNITNEDGTEITSLEGYDYVAATDTSNESFKGFDITNKSGVIEVFTNREITTTSTKTEKWNVTVTFINYDFNQAANAGKSIKIKLMIQKEEEEFRDLKITVADLPSTYGATGSITCGSSTASYSQKYNEISFSSLGRYDGCTLTYTEPTSKTYLNDYIIGLTGTSQGNGQVVNENGYRYEGRNPNNYIWFNNELWRIIGVFDENSHGQSNTNLVKIMRANSIGGLVWDKVDMNDWTTSSLNSLLNGAYLNAQDGTNSGFCYMYCYDDGDDVMEVQANCDYRTKGIQEKYRGMIENVTWYLGASPTYHATALEFYGYERGTTVYSGRPTSTTGYIGLMYPSDYGYSVLSLSCARTTDLESYYGSSCGGQSWITENESEWLLSPDISDDYVYYLVLGGNVDRDDVYYYNRVVRPVLYLKTDVYYIDGDGSIENPIIIGK